MKPQEDLRPLLIAAGRAHGSLPDQAAVHLLVFTGAPDTDRFRGRHVDITELWPVGGRERVRGALVRDWSLLLGDRGMRHGTTQRKVLEIAASFASGRRISLSEQVTNGLGWVHARRVIEAVMIATGTDRLLDISGTAQLDEMRRVRAELSGGG